MTRTLLLVEHNPSDEKLALRALGTPFGVDIVVTRDGQETLDYLLASPTPQVALVLLDLKLPRIDGREVLRRLRADARTSLIPIVALTTSMQEEDVIACYALGANGYVRKPVDFTRFAAAMQAVATFWLAINEPPPRR